MLKMNKGNMAISKNERILLSIIGCLAIVVVCYTLIIQPSFKKTKTISKENEKLAKEIDSIKNIDEEISNKNKQLEELSSEYKKASESLPEVDRYPSLSNDLNNLAKKNKLNVITSQYEEAKLFESKNNKNKTKEKKEENKQENEMVKSLTGLEYLEIRLDLEGNKNDVINFIGELEKTDRILVVDTLNLDEKKSSVNIIYYISGKKEKEIEEYDFN
ncbi:type 4a pilus biogenesis protein PilO [Clostridium baratii]|uniref:type 4a pilus biogenesis protein PilO n=1 Tax=Clostridium baratii TaxID=1561 RepID=UPI0030D2CACB